MKSLALVGTLLASAGAFMAPSAHRAPTRLYSEEADETTTEYRGAQAISALTADVKTQFSLEDIAKVLPHRYPFLLVDKVRPQVAACTLIPSSRGGRIRLGSLVGCPFDDVPHPWECSTATDYHKPAAEEKSNFLVGLLQ